MCIYFDGVILKTTIYYLFESRQQITLIFNKNMFVYDMKKRIRTKIIKHCGRKVSKLVYKFSISLNPINYNYTNFKI